MTSSRLKSSAIVALLTAASFALAAEPAVSETPMGGFAARSTSQGAAPGLAPDGASGGIYLDENGHVLALDGPSAQAAEVVTPFSGCTPGSGRDNPHYTAPDVSGHGWWTKGNCSGTTATVYNCLYEYYTDGTWRQKACSPKKKLKPGGGSAQRTNARVTCDSTGESISWRNHVDVDVNGESDTAEEPMNQANVYCVVD